MAHFLDDVIDEIWTSLSNAIVAFGNYNTFMHNAAVHLKANQVYDAGVDLDEARLQMFFVKKWTVQDTKSVAQQTRNALILLRTNWPEDGEPPPEYELTMDKILSVMVAAQADDIQYFVGLVDAYRTSIWNKPFNEEFFAALARGFM